MNTDAEEPTSSERRPDDPPYGLDPVVHVRLGVGHEQEGLMADWRAVLLSRSTCGGGKREAGETETGLTDKAAASSSSRVSVKGNRWRRSSEKGDRLVGSLMPKRGWRWWRGGTPFCLYEPESH